MASPVVVDTDVISFVIKHDTRAEQYKPHLEERTLLISFMSVAEIDRWVLQSNWGAKRLQSVEEVVDKFVFCEVNRTMCRIWGEISDGARRNGRTVNCSDAWVAATAIAFDVPLVTHNRSHFTGIDKLTVLSEAPG